MKRNLSLKGILFFFMSGLFLFSCSTDDDSYYIDRDQIAGFMAINTVTDQERIGVSLSGVRIGQALTYRAYTGGYVNIYPGERSTNSFSPYSGNTLSTTDFTYEKGKYYSLFIIGKDEDYQNIIIEDSLNDLAVKDSIAYVRYINAIPNENISEITIGDSIQTFYTETAPYGEVSGFIPVAAQSTTIKVVPQNDEAFERTIELESRKVYTLLIVGDPESDNAIREAQIRYIENGKLIEEDREDQAINLK